MIGWRGNPKNPKDAPEHWLMGERTLDFLKLTYFKQSQEVCIFLDRG